MKPFEFTAYAPLPGYGPYAGYLAWQRYLKAIAAVAAMNAEVKSAPVEPEAEADTAEDESGPQVTRGTVTFTTEGSAVTIEDLCRLRDRAELIGIPAYAEITYMHSQFHGGNRAEITVNWQIPQD